MFNKYLSYVRLPGAGYSGPVTTIPIPIDAIELIYSDCEVSRMECIQFLRHPSFVAVDNKSENGQLCVCDNNKTFVQIVAIAGLYAMCIQPIDFRPFVL